VNTSVCQYVGFYCLFTHIVLLHEDDVIHVSTTDTTVCWHTSMGK